MVGPASLTGRFGNSTAGRYVQGGLAAAQERVAQAQQRLAQANAEREQSTAQAEQQLGDFQQRERSARLSLGDAGYLAGVAAEPVARAKRAEQATKFRGDLAKSVANAVHINKDDQEAISKADLMAAVNTLDPVILEMAAQHGDAEGSVMRAAQDMVRFGMNGGLEGFIMAQAQGIPAQAFAEAYAQLTDKDPQLRAQKALMLAQRGAAR